MAQGLFCLVHPYASTYDDALICQRLPRAENQSAVSSGRPRCPAVRWNETERHPMPPPLAGTRSVRPRPRLFSIRHSIAANDAQTASKREAPLSMVNARQCSGITQPFCSERAEARRLSSHRDTTGNTGTIGGGSASKVSEKCPSEVFLPLDYHFRFQS